METQTKRTRADLQCLLVTGFAGRCWWKDRGRISRIDGWRQFAEWKECRELAGDDNGVRVSYFTGELGRTAVQRRWLV